MEIPNPPPSDQKEPISADIDYRSKVDSSRPFSSVKEAVAIFGERFLTGEIYSPKPFTPSPKQEPGELSSFPPTPIKEKIDDDNNLESTVKKLEAELEETKKELKKLKERGSETEVAVASLNAELHRNMSKLATAEAAAAGRAAVKSSTASEADLFVKMAAAVESSPSLAQVLSVGDDEGCLSGEMRKERMGVTKKVKKLKPIIPLVGELFSGRRRKGSSSAALGNSIYSTSHMYFG